MTIRSAIFCKRASPLATWCTIGPTERRSVADTDTLRHFSESPSARAAKRAAPSSIRSANNAARRPTEPLMLGVAVICDHMFHVLFCFNYGRLAIHFFAFVHRASMLQNVHGYLSERSAFLLVRSPHAFRVSQSLCTKSAMQQNWGSRLALRVHAASSIREPGTFRIGTEAAVKRSRTAEFPFWDR